VFVDGRAAMVAVGAANACVAVSRTATTKRSPSSAACAGGALSRPKPMIAR
jgi:hypothetical protein